jgi:hypothetical protein
MPRLTLATVAALLCLSHGSLLACEPRRQGEERPPEDRPVSVSDQDSLREFEEALRPCIARARETYPAARERFSEGLPPGHTFYVVARVSDAKGRFEQVFVRVDALEGRVAEGVIASEIQLVEGFAHGDRISVGEDDVLDWLISRPDGGEEGNLLGKYLDRLQDGIAGPVCDPDAI